MLKSFIAYANPFKLNGLIIMMSLLGYTVFAYDLDRENFPKLILLFAVLFFLYYKLVSSQKRNFKLLLIAGILFRLVFFLVEPNLSQDFYRFIWDGELIKSGINPYLHTPNELVVDPTFQIPNEVQLFQGMGSLSAKHYSNYPPINQLLFALSAFLGRGTIVGSVFWMRLCIILSDWGTLYFGRKLLLQIGKNQHDIFWFFLNPLVIIELTGNLHFEGVMLFFFIWAMFLLSKKRFAWAAPAYAAAIMVKLVPVLFLPFFLRLWKLKRSIAFYILIGLSAVAYLMLFYNAQLATNYAKTIGLWFSNFEFNAGLYNLVKYVGVNHFEAKPWELIKTYGSWVKITTIGLIFLLVLFKKHKSTQSFFTTSLLLLTTYYFLSATVHPWYLTFLLGIAIFTPYRFVVLWSGLVALSYYAYSQPNFEENLLLITIEYSLVIGFMTYEIIKNPNNMRCIRKKTG